MRRLHVTAAVLLALSLLPSPARAASREPVRGRHAMVATTHELATAVGVDVLKRGGNAVDAAVAVALALAVVYPVAGNLGGGGFMLVRTKDGRATAIDYREVAPAAATSGMYLDAKGDLLPDASTVGYRAAGVPGTPAGLALALEKYGTMKWADLVEPARRLAVAGYAVDQREIRNLEGDAAKLAKFPDSRRIFLRDGNPYKEGELLRQPELAETLARMQRRGPREFYEGETARRIAADMKVNGGLITLEDLKAYRAKEREPLRGRYRGHEIITMPPPSSGGAVLLQILNMLERYDLAGSGFGSSRTLHLQVEAMRRAFADRAEYMGDADFVKVPVAELTSRAYAERRAATIDPDRATPSSEVGPGLAAAAAEPDDTTHFTIVDGEGNVVSNTYTLNLGYGSGVVARGTGVLLNNEMDDFAAKVGVPNAFGLIQKENNAIAPGKRPLSSMTPTIVLGKDGSAWFALGSPGGPTIINTVMQVIVNVIDFEMNLQEAVDAPRVHHQWLPDQIVHEPFGIPADVERALASRGHTVFMRAQIADSVRPYIGDCQAVMIEPGTGMRLGAADPRQAGRAMGY
jgi:gamma-glutamyltranspeptidase/glutathione hydrolase